MNVLVGPSLDYPCKKVILIQVGLVGLNWISQQVWLTRVEFVYASVVTLRMLMGREGIFWSSEPAFLKYWGNSNAKKGLSDIAKEKMSYVLSKRTKS